MEAIGNNTKATPKTGEGITDSSDQNTEEIKYSSAQTDHPVHVNEPQVTQDGTESENITDQDVEKELEKLRAQMELYKVLYDAGQPLPEGTADNFYPDYVKENSEYKVQVVDWMVEYSVPELYLRTLAPTTYTTWMGEGSTCWSAAIALDNLYFLIVDSKILAERLLAAGFLDYAVKNLIDEQYLENFHYDKVVLPVLRMIGILDKCLKLIPDHPAYKQRDLTQILKPYLLVENELIKTYVMSILSKVASKEQYEEIIQPELEPIRAKMESYKRLYDAGDSLPGGSDYDLCPGYLIYNTVYQAKAVIWMLEYKVPELFKRTLDEMTPTDIHSEETEYTTCKTILTILHNITDFSKIIADRLLDLGYIKYYVNILTDPQYTEHQHEVNAEEWLTYAISTTSNCITHVPGHFSYKDLKLIEVIKPYLSSNNMKFRTIAMMIYSSVIGEDESKQLDDAGCIPYIIMVIKDAIHNTNRDFNGFNIHELLECVSRIAANDDNKIKLVEAGLLQLLVNSLQKGDEQEQEISANITWNLCFKDTIKEKVVNEHAGLVDELEQLSQSTNTRVQRAAKGAMWVISGGEKHRKQKQQQSDETNHIFISYQWDNQETLVKLNQRLQDDGFQTWFDLDKMGGSTLEAMAGAVENAAVVLICASEKYKLSPNCRTEGEYTFTTKKPIVPLMMQRRYRADGWLGMLMGAKLYINFDGKYEFEEAYQMLMREITPHLKEKEHVIDGVSIVPETASALNSVHKASKMVSSSKPASWSREQVLEWAGKYNLIQINLKFQSLLESMDGQCLVEFCAMKQEMPETFYKLATEKYGLDTLQYLRLRAAIAHIRKQ